MKARSVDGPGRVGWVNSSILDQNPARSPDDRLRRAYAPTRAERPFRCDAFVVLPDHLHAISTLPAGDSDHSTRWRLIKARFVREVGLVAPRSLSQAA
jgi:REP element-mobilizing transposase RayT